MGKRVIICLFVALALVKSCVIPLIYLDFNLRHDYIVKNLCINRDRPQLNCDGKCYLAKRIAAAQEKEQREAERNFIFQLCETIAEPIRGLQWMAFDTDPDFLSAKHTSFQYSANLIGRIPGSGVFHPPIFA